MVKFRQFFQANQIDDFDRYLPKLPLVINVDFIHFNLSTWNQTNSTSSNTIYRHPLLYGAAIYAFLLIIIGTIGKEKLSR